LSCRHLPLVIAALLATLAGFSHARAAPPSHQAKGSTSASQPVAKTPANASLTMPERYIVARSRVQPKVVLLGDDGQKALKKRLGAELGALGLTLVNVESRARTLDTRLAELGAQAVAQRAVAAVRIDRKRDKRQVTLWLYDAITGKMVFRRATLKASGTEQTTGVPFQVVELLHASLLELNLPARRKRLRQSPPPKQVERIVVALAKQGLCPKKKTHASFFLAAGPAIATSGFDAPSFGIELLVSMRVLPWLAISASGYLPFAAAALDTPNDTQASMAPFLARVRVQLTPWYRWRPISLGFSLGLGLLAGYASGDDTDRYLGRTDWGSAPVASLGLTLRLRLTRLLRLMLAVDSDIAPYSLDVRVEGARQARLGPVVLSATLALGLSFGAH
jgi:hypothetical protein